MNPMRVRGKVVGNTVVLEEPLPEGAEVEVRTTDSQDEDDFVLTEEMHRELDEAEEELARGGGIDFDVFMARLPPA